MKLAGKKLRAGTVPWRYQESGQEIEVFLIEGLNTPGFWSFPAGSLDPGEEVSLCAMRETYEESGARGNLGCFLGVFEEKNRTYLFSMQVTFVQDAENEIWHDPHSAYEGSGARRRGWFSPEKARPLLKKDGPSMLEAFLSLPAAERMNPRSKRGVCDGKKVRLLVMGGAEVLKLCAQHAEARLGGSKMPRTLQVSNYCI